MKPDIGRLINKIKSGVKVSKTVDKIKVTTTKTSFNPVIKPTHRERDMRQEAMDMGSHGAKEFFGGIGDKGVSNK